MRDEPYVTQLQHRIQHLEQLLAERPTNQQIEYVAEYARRQKKLYEVVLARNTILKRRLDEAQQR
jgi:hypothetical protein